MTNFLVISFSDLIVLFFGIIFGVTLSAIISAFIISNVVKNRNHRKDIRKYSEYSYENFIKKNIPLSNAMLQTLKYEAHEIALKKYPNDQNPEYELSINDIIKTIKQFSKKIDKVVYNPLLKDIRKITLSNALHIEEMAKPVMKIAKNKFIKFILKIYDYIHTFLNLINPVYILRKILSKYLFKQGKKDIILVCFDFLGNQLYDIYGIQTINDKSNDKK